MVGAAAYGEVVVLDEAEGGVAQGGVGPAEVGAGVGPGEASLGVEVGAGPVLHGDDGEVGGEVVGGDVVAGELTEGKAVTDGEGYGVDVGFVAGVGEGTLDGEAAEGVGAVEEDDLEVVVVLGLLGGCCFEEVAGGGFVSPEADARVLEVDDDGVEAGELGVGGVAVGVVGAVEADDGEVGGEVGFGLLVGGVLLGGEAVFGGEEERQGLGSGE